MQSTDEFKQFYKDSYDLDKYSFLNELGNNPFITPEYQENYSSLIDQTSQEDSSRYWAYESILLEQLEKKVRTRLQELNKEFDIIYLTTIDKFKDLTIKNATSDNIKEIIQTQNYNLFKTTHRDTSMILHQIENEFVVRIPEDVLFEKQEGDFTDTQTITKALFKYNEFYVLYTEMTNSMTYDETIIVFKEQELTNQNVWCKHAYDLKTDTIQAIGKD